jgi:hypothetical protein
MGRRNRSVEGMNQLIEKFHQCQEQLSKEEFCKQEQVSTSCFYRHLNRYQSAKLLVKKPVVLKKAEPKFIEISPKEPIKFKPNQNILIKLFGFKIFSLEVVHV